MNSYTWNVDNSSRNDFPYSFDYKTITHIKNSSFDNSNSHFNKQRKKRNEFNKNKNHDFNYLLKYVHEYFVSFYKNEEDDYNIKMIEDILDNEETHLVAEFKDFLIIGDLNEFMQKYYSLLESRKYIPKICDYYTKSSLIFPNYVSLNESKYIYKNIRKKQKLIDQQQEQDELKEKKEKNKKDESSSESVNNFFSSKTLNSILQQSNTSNVKIIFGIDDNKNNNKKNNINNNINKNSDLDLDIDNDETPMKIIDNLEEIEKGIKEIKDNKNIKLNNTNIKKQNKKENDSKNKKYSNILKINNSNTSSNKSSNIYKRNKKRIINNNLSKKQTITENNSKNYNKSNSSITGKESNYVKKKYINYFFINSQKKNKRKILIKNSLITNKFNTNINNINNNINNNKNCLIPSKACISKFFINNNYSHSVLKYNSFNFITNRNSNIFPFSSSLHTLQVNPLKKKCYYDLNININNSNSAKNMNNKILSSKSSENTNDKNNINNNNDKNKKNKMKLNKYVINKLNNKKGHNHAISLTINILNNKEKNIFKQKCLTDRNKESKSENTNIHIKNNNNLKTIGNSKNIKNKYFLDKIINSNRNKKLNIIKNEKIKSIKNKHINHIKIKSLNFQKINSLSNIKKITINLTNKKQKENSKENIFKNKIFPKSPISVKLDKLDQLDSNSNKTLSIKRTFNIKTKKNKNNIYKNINTNNNINIKDKHYFIDSILNSPKNKHQIINSGIKDKIIIEELNKKKSIILPFKKEINIINININGYNNNTEKVSLTSRESKNKNKKKLKEYKGRNRAEINFYNQEVKTKLKNKSGNNNIKLKNDKNNPVIVRSLFDNIGKNLIEENQQNNGFFTSRK